MTEETLLPRRTDWARVLLVLGAGIAAGCQIGKVPPSLPFLRSDLGLSLFTAGWAISLISLVASCGGAVAGAVADWLGHRRVALIGLGVTAVAGLCGSLARGPAELLTSRFFEGVGYIVMSVTGPVLILEATRPEDERLALGTWSGYMPAGTSLMMLVSPLFLETVGWRGLWVANGLLVAAVAVVLARTTRGPAASVPRRVGPRPRFVPGVRETLSRPGPLVLALCFGAFALQFMAVVGFLPTLLIEDLGTGKGLAAVLSAVVVAVNVPGNLAGGWLLHRGAKRSLVLGAASAVMGLCVLGIYHAALPPVLRYALCLVFTAVGGVIPACLFAAAPLLTRSRATLATTTGIMMQGGNLGSMLGPPAVAAVVAAGGGWQAAPWLITPAAAFTVGLAVLLGRIERSVLSAS